MGGGENKLIGQTDKMNQLDHIKSDKNRFSWKRRVRSFEFAIEGLLNLFRYEHNARIHLAATITVLVMAMVLKINKVEAIALSLATGFVWAAELFNTAVEKMMDYISPEKNSKVKVIKDLSAAAVLVAAISAFITGCIVFIPKI